MVPTKRVRQQLSGRRAARPLSLTCPQHLKPNTVPRLVSLAISPSAYENLLCLDPPTQQFATFCLRLALQAMFATSLCPQCLDSVCVSSASAETSGAPGLFSPFVISCHTGLRVPCTGARSPTPQAASSWSIQFQGFDATRWGGCSLVQHLLP